MTDPAADRVMVGSTWRTVNISLVERVGRMIFGLAAIIAGGVLLTADGSAPVVALEVLLVLAGLDMLVTGATGRGPLYQRLGHTPRSLRSAR